MINHEVACNKKESLQLCGFVRWRNQPSKSFLIEDSRLSASTSREKKTQKTASKRNKSPLFNSEVIYSAYAHVRHSELK